MTLRCSVVLLGALFALTGRGAAQEMALVQQAPRFLRIAEGPERVVEIDAATVPIFQRRISLALEHATLAQALAVVERDADLRLVYSRDVVDLRRIVRLKAEDITVAGALTELLLGAGVDVVLSQTGGVTLVPKKLPPAAGTVTGKVTDAKTGQGVAGARVSLQGTSLSALTNDSGGFRISNVPPGGYTLTARRIGYVPGVRQITVTADQEVAVELRLEISASPLDAVVVTGTVSAAEQKELSSPISVVTAEDIQRRGITKINDLFRGELPGVFTADYGESSVSLGAPVYVRGTTSLSTVPTLKTYVDGVEIANSQFLNEIDPAMIDHIEIVRGPEASTLYGAEAINGVMQVFTKKGSLATATRVTASLGVGALEGPYRTGIHHEDNVSVTGGAAWLSYNVGGSYEHDGTWTRANYLNAYSGYGTLTLRPAHSPLQVDVTGRLGERKAETGGGEVTYREMLDGTLVLSPGAGIPSGNRLSLPQRTLGIALHFTPRQTWQHSLTVGIDRGASGFDGTFAPTFATPADSLTTVFSTHTTRFTAAYNSTLGLHLANNVSADVTVGADYWKYHNSFAYNNFAGYATSADLRDHSTGVFGQVRVGVAEALFLTAGARVDQGPALPADRHHRSSAPRVGVSYNVGIGSVRAKLRAGWGSALRPASPDLKQFVRYPYGSVQLAAPNLLPERQNGWDAGVEIYAGDRASLSLTHYRQIARDLITGVDLSDTTSQYQNLDRVRNTGWEMEGTLRLFAGLSAKATYTEVESVVEALAPNDASGFTVGQALPGVPHHTGALTLAERTPRLSLEAGVDYVGTSSNFDLRAIIRHSNIRLGTPDYSYPLATLPAAYRLALRAAYDLTPRVTLFARSENLTKHVVLDQGFVAADQIARTTVFGLRLR